MVVGMCVARGSHLMVDRKQTVTNRKEPETKYPQRLTLPVTYFL
jgi:hypothetical protein